jgi:hypothetical protein
MFGKSGEWCVGPVLDCDGERGALDRWCARDRLDCRPWSAVGEAEGKTVERRISLDRVTDLLEEGIEGSVARRRIALLEVDLDLDRMLVVRAPEAAERLLRRGTCRRASARTGVAIPAAPPYRRPLADRP